MHREQSNFDHVARPYRWLEYLSFGPYLERCRFYYLEELKSCRHALILGDGDGRFTARLLARYPEICVEAVDSSAAMLQLLGRRVSRHGQSAMDRLTLRRADALAFRPGGPDYDLIVTHFFLDCFSEGDIAAMIEELVTHLDPDATWLISEFSIPEKQPAAFLGRMIVSLLYKVFGLLTGLRVRRLPGYHQLLYKAGFELSKQEKQLAGLLQSEQWILRTPPSRQPASSRTTPNPER